MGRSTSSEIASITRRETASGRTQYTSSSLTLRTSSNITSTSSLRRRRTYATETNSPRATTRLPTSSYEVRSERIYPTKKSNSNQKGRGDMKASTLRIASLTAIRSLSSLMRSTSSMYYLLMYRTEAMLPTTLYESDSEKTSSRLSRSCIASMNYCPKHLQRKRKTL